MSDTSAQSLEDFALNSDKKQSQAIHCCSQSHFDHCRERSWLCTLHRLHSKLVISRHIYNPHLLNMHKHDNLLLPVFPISNNDTDSRNNCGPLRIIKHRIKLSSLKLTTISTKGRCSLTSRPMRCLSSILLRCVSTHLFLIVDV